MRRSVAATVDFDAKGGKNRITKAGKYHFHVVGPEEGIESENEAKFELEVIGAADAEQVNKTAGFRLEFSATDPKYQDTVDRKIAAVTSALQLTERISGKMATMDNWKEWRGKEVDFDFESAKGRQFVAEVKMREFDEKDKETGQPTRKKLQTPDIMWWTMVPANDPRAAGYPRNPEYLALLGPAVAPAAGQQAATKPAASPPSVVPASAATQAGAAAVVDPWAGIA